MSLVALVGIDAPARPSLPADYEINPGNADGEIDFILTTLGDAGDATTAGDGAGTITGHRWRIYPTAWATVAGATTTGTFTVSTGIQNYGQLKVVQLQPLGTNGRAGALVSENIVIPGFPISAPANTVAPVLAGPTPVGSTLFLTEGTWTGTPTPTLVREFLVNGVVMASGDSFATNGLLVGDVVQGRVTATNTEGQTAVTSNTITVTSAAETFFLLQQTGGDQILIQAAGDSLLTQEIA